MFIAIDIGGTHLRVAGSRTLKQPALTSAADLDSENDYAKGLAHLRAAIERAGGRNIQGIGLGIPAVLSADRSQIMHYTNLPGWNGRPLIADLEKTFQCPVRFENDAVAAAAGEAFYGHGVGQSFLHLTWGTGIGGAAVEADKEQVVLSSFEPGHQILDLNATEADRCGQKGCWEYFCGGGAIQKRLKKTMTELSPSEWKDVLERFAQGMVNLLALRPTALVTLGGGVISHRPDLVDDIAALVQRRLKIVPMPTIRPSKLGESGGLLGALALLRL